MSPIRTPFGFDSTAADVVAGIDLSGKTAIVTGGASGIGVETARALAAAGASVTIAARDAEAGNRVADDIGGDVVVVPLDLLDRDSIDAFTDSWDGPLHILVNNAGVMALPDLQLTPEGWETQFATNHLGHFALTLGLHESLADAGEARVVSVSSAGHLRSPVVFDDIHYAFRAYDPWSAYGQSKTANVLLAVEITRRWADDGITANALMPGAIMTNLQRHITQEQLEALRAGSQLRFKTSEQGAATSVLLASSPQLEGIGGRYFEDCNEAPTVTRREGSFGVAPYALDPANAKRLWDVSTEMLRASAPRSTDAILQAG
jgi:NAD(P)-dependent dehydrogenase (short-subunit alcohol dehydrogenase family)